MKKTLLLLLFVVTISCQNKTSKGDESSSIISSISKFISQDNTPKCDESDVFKTIYEIIKENKKNIGDVLGGNPLSFYPDNVINSENIKITEIMTSNKDSELKSCGCEAKLSISEVEPEFLSGLGLIEMLKLDPNYSKKKDLIDKALDTISVPMVKNKKYESLIQYRVQRNSENNLVVKVENIFPLELKEIQ